MVGLNVLPNDWNCVSVGPVGRVLQDPVTQDRFGWAVLYRDYTWRNEFPSNHPSTGTAPPGLNVISVVSPIFTAAAYKALFDSHNLFSIN